MIEAFLPPLNNKGGDLLGTMYEQVEDPDLISRGKQSSAGWWGGHLPQPETAASINRMNRE